MRIAIVSDIHGNRTAFEAVLADLKDASPDLVFHGGDLADRGSSPAEIVDRIRDLGWQGVLGNMDEMLFRRDSLEEFASRSSVRAAVWKAIREAADWTRTALGEERLAWMNELPRVQLCGPMALTHASPDNLWRAPMPEASDQELEWVYEPLRHSIVIYGHIHRPYIRNISGMTIANSGSISLSNDGDYRASYLLLDESKPTIRRVEYDLDREMDNLATCEIPHLYWIARMIKTGSAQNVEIRELGE